MRCPLLKFRYAFFRSTYRLGASNVLTNFRTALFWVVTQRIVAIFQRRFGTTYRSSLQHTSCVITQRALVQEDTYFSNGQKPPLAQ